MQKIKIYISILLVTIGFSSCSEYYKVLNKGTAQMQYKMATKMYEEQNYNKAIQLLEKITPFYRGKPQMERVQFMISQAHYNTKQYTLSSYYFDKFVKNYPRSSKAEEAAYLSARSYFLASPRYSLDQTDTYEAINALQNFIYKYPDSDKIHEASQSVNELTEKLETKFFEIAKQYYHTEDFIAAVTAFDNFLEEFLGTKYKEEALYLRFMSSYKLAVESYINKKETRINDAFKAHIKFKRNYPESSYLEETEELVEFLNNEISIITEQKKEADGL